MFSEWQETTIGQQVTLQRGIDITKAQQRVGSVPVVSSGGISSYHDTAHAKGPGVVLGRKGTLGTVFFIQEDYWPHDTSLWVRDFHGNDPRFVYYFFRSIASDLLSLDVGTSNPTLNRNHVHPIKILWPSLDEQRAIARILGALDDKIELNRQMNRTLEAMAQSLFKSWFVDFDPVTAKAAGRKPYWMNKETAVLFPDAFEDSELGEIPRGWTTGQLGEIAQVIMGLSPKGDTYNEVDDGIPLVNGPVEFGEFFTVKKKWTTSPTRLSQKGDLIFCVRGSTTGRRVFADDVYCLGRGVCAIRASDGKQVFVNQLIDFNIEALLSKTTGSIFPNLSAPDIKEFAVLIPSTPIINRYCALVRPLEYKRWLNTKEEQTLASLRDTLLPKLLSGEIRVRQAENLVAEAV